MSFPELSMPAFGRANRHLRLDTLVRLRWLAIAGQSLTVAGVHFGLGFTLPFGWCFTAIAVSSWLNIALRIRFPLSHRLRPGPATALLAFDIVQLSVLLFLTGGLQNPFSILLLAPVMISATALPPQRTLLLGCLAIALATLVGLTHLPLPWNGPDRPVLPLSYQLGNWAALVLGLGFTGSYAWRVAKEARDLSDALAATELVLAREQHLSQLDGLAAAAAHELGTPLATIALVARELSRLAPAEGEMADDIALLREQVERCRGILGKLASLQDDDGSPLDQLGLRLLIEEAAGPQRPFGVPFEIVMTGEKPEPVCRRNPGMIYGLGNIVDNAVDFASSTVTITAEWNQLHVTLTIADDGPGFPPDVLLRAGDPYLTHGTTENRAGGGLGLGLFIAKTLLERGGAVMEFSNLPAPASGACVRMRWLRDVFEADLLLPGSQNTQQSIPHGVGR
ncbi:ActS/PrrB/RegB family redox-sensitive histidine kinase [Bosea sp. (in: a-proteobacteria)]|uniref:ActS/PrrB/RegB family redox-sensitive histidine kinase n=1 Tax=Bosea sp. (in: a-proteobacteria) TaxID=1871050 RepID=UPI002733D2B8|nr:ActS/PrrB/RegB family redox-sensitive histidine kinase [Bosea sp. (in: a-proteobacteria)]MDP3409499.1 ActS/PrrB/RegB family redox-sensitive histidine kinase [Bosea sp. (in: a-proteobacteria)]